MTVSEDILNRFPEFAEFLNIPDIANLIELAAAGNFSQTLFQQGLWNTQWWKSTPESGRNWAAMKLNDPATAGQTAGNMTAKVHAMALGLGLKVNPAQLAYFSEAAIGGGWNDQTLTQNLVHFGQGQKLMPGQIQATQQQLLSTAANYGVNIGYGTAQKWAAGIASGERTSQGFEAYARDQAIKAFPQLADQIMAGHTVRELADPYLQIASQTLGVDPNELKLTDPKWSRALQSRDAKGNIVGPMTHLDWQKTLMTDKAYGFDKSEMGIKSAYDMRDELAKTFGLSA